MRFIEFIRFIVAAWLTFAITMLFMTAGLLFIVKVSPMYSTVAEMWLSVIMVCVVSAMIATKLPEKLIGFMHKDDER